MFFNKSINESSPGLYRLLTIECKIKAKLKGKVFWTLKDNLHWSSKIYASGNDLMYAVQTINVSMMQVDDFYAMMTHWVPAVTSLSNYFAKNFCSDVRFFFVFVFVFLVWLFFVDEWCSSHFVTAELAFQKCTGGPLMLMNIKENNWETDKLARDVENPLSASLLLTGTVWMNPFRRFSSIKNGMLRGSLKNSRCEVIRPVASMLNLLQSDMKSSLPLNQGTFSPLGHFL